MSEHFIEVEHLRQYFSAGGFGSKKKFVRAVDDVSFFVNKGETLGLVGESGCGKTTTGRTMLRLYEPTDGRFVFDGETVFDVKKKEFPNMLPFRKRMQIVFQDPYASLDPRMTVGDIVGEAIDVHKLAANDKERYDMIIQMLEKVPEDKLSFVIQIMQGVNGLIGVNDTKGKEVIDLNQFVMASTERGQNADNYVRELRDNDRF